MKRGLGYEDIMHKQFGGMLRQYEGYGKLKCEFWSYDGSGEKRNLITGSLLKAKGLNGGKSDYEFRKLVGELMHHIYIEFKAPKGKQSDNQVKFQVTCDKSSNDRYYLAYSVEQGIKILEKEEIL